MSAFNGVSLAGYAALIAPPPPPHIIIIFFFCERFLEEPRDKAAISADRRHKEDMHDTIIIIHQTRMATKIKNNKKNNKCNRQATVDTAKNFGFFLFWVYCEVSLKLGGSYWLKISCCKAPISEVRPRTWPTQTDNVLAKLAASFDSKITLLMLPNLLLIWPDPRSNLMLEPG